MVVYKITNAINGKIYVGQTRQPLYKRWWRHCNNGKCPAITSAIKKYGVENFTIEVIDTATSLEELNEKERQWIEKLNTLAPNGYNLRTGGDSYEVTEIARKHLSESHKGKQYGEKNPFYGRHHSTEAKAIFAERNRGNSYAPRRKVVCVETNVVYNSISEAQRMTGTNNICVCCQGKLKTAGGYHWKYLD